MPIIKSAQKKLRQDKKRTVRNEATKRGYRTAIKSIEKLDVAGKKVPPASLSTAYKKIDKATKNHLLHPNKAARLKSRVAKLAHGA